MKPRIFPVHGSNGSSGWKCRDSSGAVGFGMTVEQAYSSWKEISLIMKNGFPVIDVGPLFKYLSSGTNP